MTLIGSTGMLAIAGCGIPEIAAPSEADWEAALASYGARLYGQVSLAGGANAGAGVSIIVAVYQTGCTGTMANTFLNQSTTDADGRFQVNSTVWKSSLPPGNPDRRVLCARITASGTAPGDTASVLVADLVHRAVVTADSTRVDLRLP